MLEILSLNQKVKQVLSKNVIFCVCLLGDKFHETWIIFSNKSVDKLLEIQK